MIIVSGIPYGFYFNPTFSEDGSVSGSVQWDVHFSKVSGALGIANCSACLFEKPSSNMNFSCKPRTVNIYTDITDPTS